MLVTYLSVNERVTNRNEIAVKRFKTGKQRPDHNDETAEVVVVIQQDLGVVTTDTHTHGLRAEEDELSSFGFLTADGCISNSGGEALLGQVGGLEPTDTLEEEASRHNGLTSNKAGLTVSRTHALVEVGVGLAVPAAWG